MDWEVLVGEIEAGTGADGFVELFAEGGQFCDPVTPWTTDVQAVADQMNAVTPDWSAHVEVLRAGDAWAVLEWTGTASFQGDVTVPVTVHCASVVE